MIAMLSIWKTEKYCFSRPARIILDGGMSSLYSSKQKESWFVNESVSHAQEEKIHIKYRKSQLLPNTCGEKNDWFSEHSVILLGTRFRLNQIFAGIPLRSILPRSSQQLMQLKDPSIMFCKGQTTTNHNNNKMENKTCPIVVARQQKHWSFFFFFQQGTSELKHCVSASLESECGIWKMRSVGIGECGKWRE